MVEPLRHRQTKGAATDMFYLTPPRHISTLLIRVDGLPMTSSFPSEADIVRHPVRSEKCQKADIERHVSAH